MNLTPLHMGALHPHEQILTLLLAFGPFLLLAAVIVVRRRQDRSAAAHEAAAEPGPAPSPPEAAGPDARQP